MSILSRLARTILDQDTELRQAFFSWCKVFLINPPATALNDRDVARVIGFAALETGFSQILTAPSAGIYFNSRASGRFLANPSSAEAHFSPSNAQQIGENLNPEGLDALGMMVIRANDGLSRADNIKSAIERLADEFKRMGGSSPQVMPTGSSTTEMDWATARPEILKSGTEVQRKLAEKERRERLAAEEEKRRVEEERLRLIEIENEQLALLEDPNGGTW